jgi:flagellin
MGTLSVLNNIPSLQAQNQLALTGAALQNTLGQLSSGSRINSGSDDAAGLEIANGLNANITALTQSASNATDAVGELQTADGALSQITTLLNSAVTLATEAASGTVTSTQQAALDTQFQAISSEIGNIGANTTYNGQAIFSAGSSLAVFMSDGTSTGTSTLKVSLGQVDASHLGTSGGSAVSISSDALTDATKAASALTDINNAISGVAALRGSLGASVNQLQAATNVMNNQVQNLTTGMSNIESANIGQDVADMTKYSILQQTGIAALQQSNQMQQGVLKLLQ